MTVLSWNLEFSLIACNAAFFGSGACYYEQCHHFTSRELVLVGSTENKEFASVMCGPDAFVYLLKKLPLLIAIFQ